MSEFNITVQGGTSVRLPTAGKYCDRDILVTAEGDSGGGNNNLKEYFEGKTTDLYWADLENIKNVFRQGDMTSINFPAVKIICANAFYACKSLKSVTIDSVTDIGPFAFYICSQLVEMRFPTSLSQLQTSAFGGCAALSSVTFDGKPQFISQTGFSSCPNLTTINVSWSQGEVAGAPWGATNATINYNYKGE